MQISSDENEWWESKSSCTHKGSSMDLKENDLVMCSVKSIEGTTVFVEIEGNGQGNIAMSEVAAGRIRNLREHISINKKIVCKVLKMLNGKN